MSLPTEKPPTAASDNKLCKTGTVFQKNCKY